MSIVTACLLDDSVYPGRLINFAMFRCLSRPFTPNIAVFLFQNLPIRKGKYHLHHFEEIIIPKYKEVSSQNEEKQPITYTFLFNKQPVNKQLGLRFLEITMEYNRLLLSRPIENKRKFKQQL